MHGEEANLFILVTGSYVNMAVFTLIVEVEGAWPL